MLSLMKDIRRE